MAKAAQKTRAALPAPKATQKPATRAIRAAKAAPAPEVEEEEEAPAPRSVVGAKYKAIYKSRPDSNKGRNNADWLAQRLAELVLVERKLDVAKLQSLCTANGVPATYENRSKGWEGRMRMTLGLRLRPIVAAQGYLAVPGKGKKAEHIALPAEWAAKWQR